MTLEQVIQQAKQLSALEKMRLIQAIAPDVEKELIPTEIKPRRSLWGICADLGQAPSAEDIDQVRQEIGLGFEREDI
ncbi:Similarity [Planktothrix tepida]|uniref:Similarity n=3 Tax=Planktothrix TaxID=54304 RepID=A0A1J1LK23_9CYAN|nr:MULTISPECIES: hypothetical protein [Planktothrix]MBE9143451.1 hypothetical protein [Planktothrix mougeotii LEGE 06226]CAD5914113.1 Similarity [Planktothrix pseudagardhii]CAD5983640.1 Similarity [Planktothrix tepida]CUR32268.1 Similarity [Planktothrix tepida PCC 9214]